MGGARGHVSLGLRADPLAGPPMAARGLHRGLPGAPRAKARRFFISTQMQVVCLLSRAAMKRALVRLALRLGWRPVDPVMRDLDAAIARARASHGPTRRLLAAKRARLHELLAGRA